MDILKSGKIYEVKNYDSLRSSTLNAPKLNSSHKAQSSTKKSVTTVLTKTSPYV